MPCLWCSIRCVERLAIPETADEPRETIAIRIVELACKGERDPERLRDKAYKEHRGAGRSSLKPRSPAMVMGTPDKLGPLTDLLR